MNTKWWNLHFSVKSGYDLKDITICSILMYTFVMLVLKDTVNSWAKSTWLISEIINLSKPGHGQGGRLEHITESHLPSDRKLSAHWQEVSGGGQTIWKLRGWQEKNCGLNKMGNHGKPNVPLDDCVLCWCMKSKFPNIYLVAWVKIYIYV